MTLRQVLTAAAAQLAEAPHLRDSARRDAELLLLHHLGISRTQLLADPDRKLTEEEELSYGQSVLRRSNSEPIQYIIGQQEFYGLSFHVTPVVLIPRPETEHLVNVVLQELPNDQYLHILDVGTGSGVLAITLALQLPYAEVTAVDISAEALAIARQNAETHRVTHRIHLIESDLLAAVPAGRFDAIVSNPPYISELDRASLHPQVRDHEPALALFAGETGLAIYRRLVPQAHDALGPGGLLALEIGHGQRDAVASLLQRWHNVSFVNDLQQVPRVALARRQPDPIATR